MHTNSYGYSFSLSGICLVHAALKLQCLLKHLDVWADFEDLLCCCTLWSFRNDTTGVFLPNIITSMVARNLGGNPAVQGFTTLYLALYLYERRVASYPGPAQLSVTCSMEKRTSTNTDTDSWMDTQMIVSWNLTCCGQLLCMYSGICVGRHHV